MADYMGFKLSWWVVRLYDWFTGKGAIGAVRFLIKVALVFGALDAAADARDGRHPIMLVIDLVWMLVVWANGRYALSPLAAEMTEMTDTVPARYESMNSLGRFLVWLTFFNVVFLPFWHEHFLADVLSTISGLCWTLAIYVAMGGYPGSKKSVFARAKAKIMSIEIRRPVLAPVPT